MDRRSFLKLAGGAALTPALASVISSVDGAHMLAGQPLAATIGYGTQADLIASLSLDLNGNAITLSNRVWQMIEPKLPKQADGKPKHPISAKYLKRAIETFERHGQPFNTEKDLSNGTFHHPRRGCGTQVSGVTLRWHDYLARL